MEKITAKIIREEVEKLNKTLDGKRLRPNLDLKRRGRPPKVAVQETEPTKVPPPNKNTFPEPELEEKTPPSVEDLKTISHEEETATNTLEPVGSGSNTYKIQGSFNQQGKYSTEIEMLDSYFVKAVYMADGDLKVGIIHDEQKKLALKELRGELTQMTIENISDEFGPVIKYPIALDNKILTAPNSFFDEIHAYRDFKFAYAEFMYIKLCCTRSGHLIIDDRKRLMCSKCGKTFPNTGTFKPKTAIQF